MAIKIRGRIIDRQSQTGISGLTVEIWSLWVDWEELLFTAETREEGIFQARVDDDLLRDNAVSEIDFRVIRGEAPITEILAVLPVRLDELPREIVIEVEVPASTWRVTGQVRNPDGFPLPEHTVRAFDQDGDQRHLLGETLTDEFGVYTITYSPAADQPSVDLLIAVFSAENDLLGESEMLFDARPDVRMDVVIAPPVLIHSEYEELLSKLPPDLPVRELAALSPEKLSALAERLGIERSHLTALAGAATLAQETHLPLEILYGLVRRDIPADVNELFSRPPEALRSALETAVATHLIPASTSIDERLNRIEQQRPSKLPLPQIAAEMGLNDNAPLLKHLADQGIHTLSDIRAAGGINHLVEQDDAAVRTLEAYASLSLLTTNLDVNRRFIKAGYQSLADIAGTPRDTFIASLDGAVGAHLADQAYTLAGLQTRLVDTILADRYIHLANGETQSVSQALEAALPRTCACEDCLNANSPLAYLADLLDYTMRHLKYQGTKVTLSFLEDHFHQPFDSLPVNCAAVDFEVRQVRLCIEVLRQYLPAQYANLAPDWYLEGVYTQILEWIGTSFDEIRRTRTWKDVQREELAKRLGLFIDNFVTPNPPRPDILDELFLDPHDPAQLNEDALEGIFGFPATTRPVEADLGSHYFARRLDYLQFLWLQEDYPQNPPTGRRPMIDPDIVGVEDFVFAVLTPPAVRPNRTPNMPIHLWEDRLALIADWKRQIVEIREHPDAGFESLITDEATVNGRLIKFNLGLGITIQNFQTLRDRRQIGDNIKPDLQGIGLSVEAFDFLASIWEVLNLNPAGTVLDMEWEQGDDILIQRLKESLFPVWRSEEAARIAGLTLSSRYFRLRTSPPDTDWLPRLWRSDADVRQDWVDTLRGRIEQENGIREGIQAMISAVEEAWLIHLRDELIRWTALPGVITLEKLAALTQRLQIDCEAGSCQMTTRVAQAIETLQGILFGARNGLLEDGDFQLDAPHFDEEWSWIGSFATWRASIQVYLYPENALRPILRPQYSSAFETLFDTLQNTVPVTPKDAEEAAELYSDYFRDICSLTPVAIYETGNWSSSHTITRGCLVIARAASNKLYFAAFDYRPWSGGPTPDHSMWAEIQGLPSGSDIKGIVPSQTLSGKVELALYVSHTVGGATTHYVTTYDGLNWKSVQPISDLPPLISTREYYNELIPAVPALVSAGVNGWRMQGSDRIIPMVVEGFGSRNRTALLVVAGTTESGMRRVGLLRGQEGGLVLTEFTTINGAWNIFPGGPHILSFGGTQRLLISRPDGTRTQLGLLGTGWPQRMALSILWQTTDGFVHSNADQWEIKPNAVLVAADIDVNLYSELLTLEYPNGTSKLLAKAVILRATSSGLELVARASFENSNPAYTGPGTDVRRLVPVRFGNYPTLMAVGLIIIDNPDQDDPVGYQVIAVAIAWAVIWDSVSQSFKPFYRIPETDPQSAKVTLEAITHHYPNGGLSYELPDNYVVLDLPDGGQGVFPISPTRRDIQVLTRKPNNIVGVTWNSADGMISPAVPGTAGIWSFRPDDRFFSLGVTNYDSQRDVLVVNGDGNSIAGLDVGNNGELIYKWRISGNVEKPGVSLSQSWRLMPNAQYAGIDLDGDGAQEIVTLTSNGTLGILHSLTPTSPQDLLMLGGRLTSVTARDIIARNSSLWTANRQAQIEDAYYYNDSPARRRYLDEAYLFVPLQIAMRLRESGYYTTALDWLRSIYDYTAPMNLRKIAYRLVLDETSGDADNLVKRSTDWLIDPLNPHSIAETRRNSYTKSILLMIVHCLLDFADAEFTRATSESIPRARELYLEALELLDLPVIKRNPTGCDTLIGDLQIEFPGDYQGIITQILDKLRQINDPARLAAAVEQIQTLINSEEMSADLLARIQGVVDQALEQDRPRIITYGELMGNLANGRRRAEIAALSDSALLGEVLELGNGNLELQVELGELESRLENLTQWLPGRQLLFCCPPNSVIEATRTRAESNLFKLRHCRNIAGLEMQVEPYAMPSITGSPLPPLPYRYSVLIQRAQQLVQFAQQMENSMLNALVTLGQRQYEHVKARQDLALAQASVRLKELQRIEAADGVALAQLQRGRAQLQARHYSQLLFEGLSTGELAALGAMAVATTAEFAGIYSAETVVKWAGAAAAAFGRAAELASTAANYERREQEWRFQRDIAAQDIISAQEQIRLAYDRVLITTEDREAARMGVQFAETILDFMETKRFDNAALYEWMSSVLEQVYRFFLQQATSIARLAEAQLAFERQEIPPAFIQTDYWEPPAKSKPPTANGQTANVHGLTGSARLLRDITELDQYAFRTDQRKLQLAETFSLMQLDPIAFQHFRETGKLPFDTPMRLFESKFPGHYLRLIRRVKLSVIALIPPTQGIRATLSTVGTSRVVIRDNIYQTVNIQRGPETIALTSPINATGLFDLDPQPEMLVPFEGIGVDTSWVFHLPKAANQFDYNTIADVLFTLEYTALNDFDYAQRVIKRLDSQFSADRPFSFRRDFADAWWDLHNPEQTPKPFVVSFQTGESDFPANVEDLRIGQVVLYFAFRQGKPTPVDALNLQYSYLDPSNNNQPVNVGPLSAVPIKGIISTRANAWIQLRGSHRVEGTWTLDFNPPAGDPQRVQKLERLRALFDGDHLDDLLLVITCSGRTPVW